ncbi:hypothetical protein NDU88_002470 [Pleurodeles waltl]|uniref:Uncharacterized protein n=1 Tax=Pleurodeles waltl TaxID=8319 RepID=A0AAV7KSS3_PLEWA|nr:hypothetical protein NDU88_002470 [Pleurodeles waltl]
MLQATTVEDDPLEDMDINEEEEQDPVKDPQLQRAQLLPARNQDTLDGVGAVSPTGTSHKWIWKTARKKGRSY